MTEGRRLAAIIVLFLLAFAMVGLATAVDAYWPLFLMPIPLVVIPWLAVHADDAT